MNTTSAAPLLAFVEQYGAPVFPCREDKTPFTAHGFKDASRDATQIAAWRKQYPKCLWGMPTGRASGFFVVDVDIKPDLGKHGDEALAKLCQRHGALPASAEALTPSGGKHLYFAHPPDVATKSLSDLLKAEIGSGLDIRADGGYVVIPPSKVNGHAYEWEASADPAEAGFAAAPTWLVDLVRADRRDEKREQRSNEGGAFVRALDGIRAGTPLHDSLRDLAAAVVARGFRFEDACALLRTLLESSTAPRDARFAERRDEIPKLVDTALRKYRASGGASDPNPHSLQDITAMQLPPLHFLVDGLLPFGAHLLVGPPKCGKTFLAQQLSIAVAGGRNFLGSRVQQGDVLYLALEDNWRRIRSRFAKLGAHGDTLDRIHVATEWPRADEGGIQAIEEFVKEHPATLLVVVDTAAMFRPRSSKGDNVYESDYAAGATGRTLVADGGRAVLTLHHTNKRAVAADPLDMISGSLGLAGAVDGAYLLLRDVLLEDKARRRFVVRSRDLPDMDDIVLEQDANTCGFSSLGAAHDFERSQSRRAILDALGKAPAGLAPKDVANECDLTGGNVRKLLKAMLAAGDVWRDKAGKYRAGKEPPAQHGLGV